jgi:hypothetical protein
LKKQEWLKTINPILFVLILFQVSTAALHEVLNDEVFEVVHSSSGVLLAMAAVTHLVLNWSWVKATYFKKA